MLRHLAVRLVENFDVILVGRHEAMLKGVVADAGNPAGLGFVALDLVKEADRLDARLEELLPEGRFWGIVHGASLPILQQSILDATPARLAEEWAMTATVPIRLAQWLRQRTGEQGGRILMIGSESAKLLPQLHALPRTHLYGLGKRMLRETARVLAQELAAKKITVNTIHPGPIPQGMNAGMSPTSIRMLEAENPMKRLCDAADLSAAVLYFLGEQSGYVSGQDLYLNGGRF
jgi:NAD(P)-dependent dehydrogenase (short-subunit alcohol dehydrogenase family)